MIDYWFELTGESSQVLERLIMDKLERDVLLHMRRKLEPARARASAAYSAGRFHETAEIYQNISEAYRIAGFQREADTFAQRELEVLEHAAAQARGR